MSLYDYEGSGINYAYDVEAVSLLQAYDYDGNIVFDSFPTKLSLLDSSTVSDGQSCQGMATYGNYIFQFWSRTNKMRVYNKSDYSLVNEMNCTVIGHGNNLQFGTEVQANGFPYLYCSDSNSADARYIYVLSVTTSSLTLVETITLPSAVGNFPNAVIDFVNGKIYTLGYTASSVYTATGKCVVCILDLNNPTTVIDSWQYDYLGVMNGLVWNGKHIVLNANTWDGYDVKFYFINPNTNQIDDTLTLSKEYDSEYQGFSLEQTYYLVSKWIYKTVSGTRKLFYEFYSLS